MAKNVLLVTDGFFHPPFWARWVLRRALTELDGFDFAHIRSLEKLPENLSDFSALVLYFHHKKLSQTTLEKLRGFVTSGGGVLGVHSATASFKGQDAYFEVLGGQFTGHGKVEPFKVERVESEIFAGIDDFVVTDELYLHDLQPGIDVHFTANYEGKDVPAVWTYHFGEGRVCYAVPGHTVSSLKNPTYQKLLQRGLMWVSNA